MDASVSRDAAFDVSDSTDWLGTPLAGLMAVEQAFRCHVCKDFYSSPMITSCSHTFCSLCIRRSLSVDGKCPLCRVTDQESKLRGNWAMREAVDAFVASRPAVLDVARRPPAAAATVGARSASPKRKAEEDAVAAEPESKRPRMNTRASKAKAAEATAAMMIEEIDAPESKDGTEYEPDDGLVACPICWKRMKPVQVDRHLDTSCPGEPQPSPQPQKKPDRNGFVSALAFGSANPAPAKIPERLAPLNYSILKDNALRKKMGELGLSTYGSRQLLEKRHKEWVTIWNANCDSARPKKRSELQRDLDVWERTVANQGPCRSSALGAQIRDKDFDGAAWAAKHGTSFKDLIASARKSRIQAQTKASDTGPAPEAPAAEANGPSDEQSSGQQDTVVDLTDQAPSQLDQREAEHAVGEPLPPETPQGEKENTMPISDTPGCLSEKQDALKPHADIIAASPSAGGDEARL